MNYVSFLIDSSCKPEMFVEDFLAKLEAERVQHQLQMAVKRLSAEEKGLVYLNKALL